MRLLVVAPYWAPHRGGIETVALEQSRRLAARGHQVTVLTTRLRGDPASERVDGVAVRRVRALNLLEELRGIPYPVTSPLLFPVMTSLVWQSDAVLMHSHAFLPSVVAAGVARMLRKPSLLLQHNSLVRYRPPWQGIARAVDSTLGRFSLHCATERLAVSGVAAEYAEGIAHKPVRVLYNGIDTQRFRPADSSQRQVLRQRFGLPADSVIALTVRRLTFKNGLGVLLEAIDAIPAERRPLLLVAGSGPDRPALEETIARRRLDNVRLLGFVPDDDLARLYQVADFFVLASRSGEGLPMVILEAFASGLPCIATRSGGQVELVRANETGWLVDAESPALLAEALLEATGSPRREAMRSKARARAESLDWERQITALEEHLAALS